MPESLIIAVLWVIVIGFIFWLLNWGLNKCDPPEPFKKLGTILIVIAAILMILWLIFCLLPPPSPIFRRF